MQRWQLKSSFFQGAKEYRVNFGDQRLTFVADNDGYFEIDKPDSFPMYGFAKLDPKHK